MRARRQSARKAISILGLTALIATTLQVLVAPAAQAATIYTDEFASLTGWTATRITLDSTIGSPALPECPGRGHEPIGVRLPQPRHHDDDAVHEREPEPRSGAARPVPPAHRRRWSGHQGRRLDQREPATPVGLREHDRSTRTSPIGTGWHNIELCGTVGSNTTWDLFRDGTEIVSDWVANTGTTPVGRIQIGDTAAKTFTINFDHVVLDEAAGDGGDAATPRRPRPRGQPTGATARRPVRSRSDGPRRPTAGVPPHHLPGVRATAARPRSGPRRRLLHRHRPRPRLEPHLPRPSRGHGEQRQRRSARLSASITVATAAPVGQPSARTHPDRLATFPAPTLRSSRPVTSPTSSTSATGSSSPGPGPPRSRTEAPTPRATTSPACSRSTSTPAWSTRTSGPTFGWRSRARGRGLARRDQALRRRHVQHRQRRRRSARSPRSTRSPAPPCSASPPTRTARRRRSTPRTPRCTSVASSPR